MSGVAPLTERFGIPVGVRIPYRGDGVTPEGFRAVVRAADEAGFDSGWVGDHVVWPNVPPSELPPTYPGGSGTYPHGYDDLQLESFTTLAIAAGASERLKLGVGVMIVSYRPAVLLAKEIASLDFLAPGRVILGVGTGWLEQEFQALGVPFDERVKRLEETVEVLRRCWYDPEPEFHGRYVDFGPLYFDPQPRGRIPLWFGGHTDPAYRRAARLADGWLQARTSPEQIERAVAAVKEARPEGMAPLEICLQQIVEPGEESGIHEMVESLRALGATYVMITPPFEDESPDALLRLIDGIVAAA
jgi:probable F420-dependent oxidoreductase